MVIVELESEWGNYEQRYAEADSYKVMALEGEILCVVKQGPKAVGFHNNFVSAKVC